jgi:hypothetical protein
MTERLLSLALVLWVSTVSLANLAEAASPSRLGLIVEGPFVLCETDDQAALRLFLPKVVGPDAPGQHFTPGIKSSLAEKELRQSKDYTLSATGQAPGAMTIIGPAGKSANQTMAVALDHISAPCQPASGSYYLSVTVPKPDSIRPLFPVLAKVYDCTTPPAEKAAYGTSTELAFDAVDLTSLKLAGPDPSDTWEPQVDPAGGYLTIYVRPLHPDSPDQAQSLAAYKAMMAMIGVTRCFEEPEAFPLAALRETGGSRAATMTTSLGHAKERAILPVLPVLPVLHNDCHAPQLLVCKNASCQ